MATALPTLLHFTLVLLGIILLIPQAAEALDLVFNNSAEGTAGGDRFDQQIREGGALEIMNSSIIFIWNTFGQQSGVDRKNVTKVTLIVESMDGIAYASGDEIHLSAEYVGNYSGDVKTEIRGVLYHEMTHVWQWDGNGNAPGGFIEGFADYVRLTAGLAPSHWIKPGSGDRWDHGYDVTAYFLQYCESIRAGFVACMNAKLKGGWDIRFFNDLTGKSVDQLWKDYKAIYSSST
ncbi:hypothetical protein SUGI_0472970 [Cryptomeria japonica]|uniref:uncharacterized protein LOC131052739 n=1 Tax=Cryptomeria japonica TaxID=3369 RepID=UPI002408CB7A|nr:uncharacterized protein LOC131052739 [Cryptomeria japonica]GLJ24740.1 hypothetical protein SUGI_0472970 [Cryptomeria japonica]